MDKHADSVGQVSLYGGAASGLALWGLNLSELGAIASAVIALAGFVLTVVMSLRRDAREREINKATLELLRAKENHQETSAESPVAIQKAQG